MSHWASFRPVLLHHDFVSPSQLACCEDEWILRILNVFARAWKNSLPSGSVYRYNRINSRSDLAPKGGKRDPMMGLSASKQLRSSHSLKLTAPSHSHSPFILQIDRASDYRRESLLYQTTTLPKLLARRFSTLAVSGRSRRKHQQHEGM
jgi:hypothetical protein